MQGPFGIYSATPPTLSDKEQAQLQLNTDGSLRTGGGGTAGTPSSNVQTVQGAAGGTPIAETFAGNTLELTPSVYAGGACTDGVIPFDTEEIASAFPVADGLIALLKAFMLDKVSIGSGDYYDMGGSRIANVLMPTDPLKAAAASTSLWVAGISRGTGTYAADSLKLKFGKANGAVS